MRNKLSLGCLVASRGLDVRLPRTRALLLGLLLAVVGWPPPPVCAEVEIDVLGEMVLMEAGGEGERVGRRSELEASMHSSFLQDFQEVTEGIRAMEAVAVETGDAAATQQNVAAPTAFPDSSAVVGQIFQMKVPNKMEDVYLGDIVKVSPSTTNLFALSFPVHLTVHIFHNNPSCLAKLRQLKIRFISNAHKIRKIPEVLN